MAQVMAWSEARAIRHMLMGSRAVSNDGRGPKRLIGGSDAGIVNVNGVGWGSGRAR